MTFALLALICAVALLGPLLSLPRTVRLPVVIGELIVGIVLGPTLVGLLDPKDPTLSFMGDIGFAMVMFVAGTHVPLRSPQLRAGLKTGLLRALAVGLLSVPVGLALAQAFGTGHGALYAVILASSSASLVLPALGPSTPSTPEGLDMLPQLVVADAACIVALPLVVDPAHAARAALGAVTVLVVAGLFFAGLDWAERSGRRRRVHELSEERALGLELRVVLVLLFSLAALAVAMHVSVMLAGFAMGLVVAAVGEPHQIANQMFALTEGLFSPLFFVWLGSTLDLRGLATQPQALWLGLALGASALVVHGLMALSHQPWPIALATGAELGVPVGAAALGTQLGVLAAGEPTSLLLGAIVTILAVALVSPKLQLAACGEPDAASESVTSPS